MNESNLLNFLITNFAIIAGICLITIYLKWLFIKSAVKKGTKEAIMECLEELDLIEDKTEI